MKLDRRVFRFTFPSPILVGLLIAVLGWLYFIHGKETMASTPITLQLNMSADAFDQALGKDRRTDKQPAGLSFHEKNWPNSARGTVRFSHGRYSFEVDSVLSVMGTEDVERRPFGIEALRLGKGLTTSGSITHDEARLKTIEFTDHLLRLGWRPYYSPSTARLKGKSTWVGTHDRDPYYRPDFQEWMSHGSHDWELEASGVYLEISIQRAIETSDPQRPGAYLMSLNFQTEEHMVRLWLPEEQRDDWKLHLSAWLEGAKERRAQKEATARAQGMLLDTAYQNPRILALDDPPITAKVGQPCPKTGWWQTSLPPGHKEAQALTKAPSRWLLVEAGRSMPSVEPNLLADASALTWAWRKAAP